MTRLALYLLGASRLEMDGEDIHIRRRKVMALLAYLAVTDRSHQRDALATLLWPECDQSSARAELRRTLSVLNRELGGDGILADRETAQLNPELDLSLDVTEFQQTLAACETHGHPATKVCPACVPLLEQAMALYRDDFLAGFTLDDSAAFDEWQFFQTEGLRNAMSSALARLVEWHGDQGESGIEPAIAYARRWLSLDPLHEPAHRHLIVLYAQSGQRSAALRQYRQCVRMLEEELGVAPTEETTILYERIRAERGHAPQADIPPAPTLLHTPTLPRLPPFLRDEVPPVIVKEPIFVAREPELARLHSYLDAALAGQGQVAFVTGGPGRGKTALLRAFARQAMAAHPDLLVASGACTAYAGVGDPYLPFREVLALLSGDVESRWAAGTLSRDHAQRLWTALPQTLPALVDRGPSLIGTLVPSAGLVARADMIAVEGDAWRRELRALSDRPGVGDLEQSALFQQISNVLSAMAAGHPLLLTLDDVQWADTGSIGLLFHLGRHLAGQRILLLGAYRPEEVESGRQGERHPLDKVLAEFKRQFGNVWIDLRQADAAQGNTFVNALVDTQTNRLGQDFRDALFARTGGHPLFTIELLRALEARGALARDAEGAWIQNSAVDWETLPARVEAAIVERLGRLDAEQRDLLAVASVEGETFTAQVIAQVQGLEERAVLRTLSHDLADRHRLVREMEEVRVDGHFLTRYAFAHALFQDYLYHALSNGERRLLHGEIATALESCYEAQREAVAVSLAHHFDQAGHVEKTIEYTLLAGEQALAVYAHEEAAQYFSRALELTPGEDMAGRYALLMTREDIYEILGLPERQQQDLAAAEALAEALDDDRCRAEVILRRVNPAIWRGDLLQAIALGQEAVRLAQAAHDAATEAQGYLNWGRALTFNGDYDAGWLKTEHALILAQEAGLVQVEWNCLHMLGMLDTFFGDYEQAKTYHKRQLNLCRETGARARARESDTLRDFGSLYLDSGDYAKAMANLEQALHICRELGLRKGEGDTLLLLGNVLTYQGDYVEAIHCYEQALRIQRVARTWHFEYVVLVGLGSALMELGEWARARGYYEQALDLSREGHVHIWDSLAGLGLLSHYVGDDEAARVYSQEALSAIQSEPFESRIGRAWTIQGHLLADLEQVAEATRAYHRALDLLRAKNQAHLVSEPLAGLAALALGQGDLTQAQSLIEEALDYLQVNPTLAGTFEPFRTYLTCYHVLRASADPRAEEVLRAAYHLLQERAAKIEDNALRRSYLENVATHREIVALYHQGESSCPA